MFSSVIMYLPSGFFNLSYSKKSDLNYYNNRKDKLIDSFLFKNGLKS